MNRSRRYNQPSKPFVAGGVYDGQQQYQQQAQQQQQQQQQQQYQQNYQSTNQQQLTQQQQLTEQQKGYQQQQQQQPQPKVEAQQMDEGAVEQQQDGEFLSEKGKPLFKRIFGDRKKSSVRTREKKIRQNRRLRKAITPKNALMALNEVKGIQMSDFNIVANQSGGFLCAVTINNTQYEGRGPSKAAAKNNACEKALRDYVIEKMIHKPRLSKANSESSVVPMEADSAENGAGSEAAKEEEDDVPMVNLASFALFKLFSEWESEGFVIPEMHKNATEANGTAAAPAAEPKKPPTIRTDLPASWETMHPATLLCMMRPGLQYQDLGVVGEKPNETQNVNVTVDGKDFKGSGRSKKLARRNAAALVCNTLFGCNFTLEVAA